MAGRDRNFIIDSILEQYRTGETFQVHLKDFEKKFLEEHRELEKTILILCKDCHRKYDSEAKGTTSMQEITKEVFYEKRADPPPLPEEQNQSLTSKSFKNMGYTEGELSEFKKMKIGQLVRGTLFDLLKKDAIRDSEMKKLQEELYSNLTFKVNYPVLKKVDNRKSTKENRIDERGWPRYYANPVNVNGSSYLITSEWHERSHEDYLKWLRRNFH